MSRFLFGFDEFSPDLFFLEKGLALPSALDVESIPLVEDILFLSVQYIGPIGVNPVNITSPAPMIRLSGYFSPRGVIQSDL